MVHLRPVTSISRKLIPAVILFSSAITIITSAYQLYSDYTKDLDNINLRLNEIRDVHLANLARGVWIADRKELQRQLDGILELPDLAYLEIVEPNNNPISSGKKLDSQFLQKSFDLTHSHRGKLLKIAVLTVQATLSNVYERLFARVTNIVISNAIKTFFVAGFILYLFNYLVTRHLIHIAHQAETTNIHSLTEPMTLSRKKRPNTANDELDIVVRSFERMKTNIKQSLDDLARSENQVRLLLDSTAEAIYGMDSQGKCTFANHAYLSMFSQLPPDRAGMSRSEILLPKELLDSPMIQQTLVTGEKHHCAHIVLHRPDETEFHAEYWSYPVTEKQKVKGAVVTILDITQRVNAEQESQRLLTILEATPDLVAICNRDGELFYLNNAGRRLIGVNDSDDVFRTSLSDFFDPESVGIIFEEGIKVADQSGVWTGETRLITKQGKCIPTSQVIIAHHSDQQDEPYFSTIARDIRERKAAEDQLQKQHEILERLVQQRTAALETSNRELAAFSYSIAHDLRSPLRSIISFSQITLDDARDKLSEDNIDCMERVVAAGKHMSDLINHILELASISRTDLNKAELDISEICEDLMSTMSAQDLQHKVSWRIQKHISGWGDPRLVRIIMQNLLENAWKFTRHIANPTIQVGTTDVSGISYFYVKDNGIGFDMQYYDKLFSEFHRLHSDSRYGGTGIGLATVARIVQRHGGKIWADSKLNEGTTFYFNLARPEKNLIIAPN